MKYTDTYPAYDGFYMPAEYARHAGTVMIWPVRAGSWGNDPTESQNAFKAVINAVSKSEKVYVLAGRKHFDEAERALKNMAKVLMIDSDDAWARDVAPTFVTNGRTIRGIDWSFNAWGGEYDGLYAHWDKDDAVAKTFCESIGVDCYNAKPFVLEGGSIHSDGEGTLMVTESCLLSKGRNPYMTKEQIEETLKKYLGAKKVLWLPRGIYNDETNEHVDNVCAFVAPAKVVLAWTDNKFDPQYGLSASCLEYLENETDARGRKIETVKLPIPEHPICVDEKMCASYTFEEGEDTRETGERLAASYVNFYFSNGALIVPQFGGENAESDKKAVEVLESVAGDREVIGIPAMAILQGGGNIHCITQQIPYYETNLSR